MGTTGTKEKQSRNDSSLSSSSKDVQNNLIHIFESFAGTKVPTQIEDLSTCWDRSLVRTWPSRLQSAKAWTQQTLPQFYTKLSSAQAPSWLGRYPSLKASSVLPFRETLLWEKFSSSPYLLQVINTSFSWCLACLCLLAQGPTKKQKQFSGNRRDGGRKKDFLENVLST